MKVSLKKIDEENTSVYYVYDATEEVRFNFHTLTEVGAPFQPEARAILKERGWEVIHGHFIDKKPWVIDKFISKQKERAL